MDCRLIRLSIQLAIFIGLTAVIAWKVAGVELTDLIAVLTFAFAINCGLTATVWLADVVARFSLPSSYYEIQPFERSAKLYERLGVREARRILRLSPAVRFSGRRQSLAKLESDMRLAETHHVISLIIIVLVSSYALIIERTSLALGLLFFGVALQVYPIMLQRYNRSRLLRLSRRKNRYAAGAA
jgi:hypothetical protein